MVVEDTVSPTPILYRNVDGNPNFPGITADYWISGWAKFPGWDKEAAIRVFNTLLRDGVLVPVETKKYTVS